MRERHGQTRLDLADRLGLREDQIAGLESGETHANAQLRRVLMTYFDCQFENLFEVMAVELEPNEDQIG
jgi:DNA-binding XRE family transcriptional regulator